MTFEQLNCFLEVARDMNFTKAANRLFLSQSTLSRQIAALESDLGVRLLLRDTRSVELTEAGRVLQKEGAELLARKTAIEEKLWRMSEGQSGRINIVTISMQGRAMHGREVYQICQEFQEKHPDITLNLSVQTPGTAVQRLDEGDADVCVTLSYELDGMPRDMEVLSIGEEQFYLIVPDGHRLAEKEHVSVADVEGEHFLFARTPAGSRPVIEAHEALGVEKRHRDAAEKQESLADVIAMVQAGLGVAILPGFLLRRNDGYQLLTIEGAETRFQVVLLWKKESANPAMEPFKQTARELLAGK